MFEKFKKETQPSQENKNKKEAAQAVLESAESILAQEKQAARDLKWWSFAATIGSVGMSMVMLEAGAISASGGDVSQLLMNNIPLAVFTALDIAGVAYSEKRLNSLRAKREELEKKEEKEGEPRDKI
jgi:ABC-type transport system involved in cytochrome bd biosynthesis fused ATPase/permease subunit